MTISDASSENGRPNQQPPNRRKYIRRRQPNDDGNYVCSVCRKEFSTTNGLSAHMKVHVQKKNQPEEDDPAARLCPCPLHASGSGSGSGGDPAVYSFPVWGPNRRRQHGSFPTARFRKMDISRRQFASFPSAELMRMAMESEHFPSPDGAADAGLMRMVAMESMEMEEDRQSSNRITLDLNLP